MNWLGKLARRIVDRQIERSPEPYAAFEIVSFGDVKDNNGNVKVNFNWNQPFIDKIKSLGFQAETDEDCVQLFFFASTLRPGSLTGDEPVQSDAHPQLSSITNELRT